MKLLLNALTKFICGLRLDAKEKQRAQKGVVALSGLMFIAGFVVAGLDYRFGWSEMPVAVTVASSVLFLVAYALYAEVMRENAYLSRTVKVEEGQTVVDTGLYGIVRHPMYMATILLFLMIPGVLGSWSENCKQFSDFRRKYLLSPCGDCDLR